MESQRIAIFGGTGFLGRHLTGRLLDAGHRLVLVARHASEPAGASETGSLRLRAGDITERASVVQAVQGADTVINLVGAVSLPDPRSYFELHQSGARYVAEAAREAKASRLIHVSALGIAADAPSAADRSKAAGEQAVREAFPEATIVRPSLVFGDDDHFLNRIAAMARSLPVIPLIGAATRFQPVHVDDLAEAFAHLLERTRFTGSTFELGGPEVYTLRQLVRMLVTAMGRKRLIAPLPFTLALPLGTLLGRLPHAPINREQVMLMMTDKVVDPALPGLADLNVRPRSLREWLARHGDQYRRTTAR